MLLVSYRKCLATGHHEQADAWVRVIQPDASAYEVCRVCGLLRPPQGEPDAMPGPDACWALEATALLNECDRLLGNWIVLRTLAGGSEAELSIFARLVERITALRAGQGAPDLPAMKRALVEAWPWLRNAMGSGWHGTTRSVDLPDAPFIAALQAAWGKRHG